MMTWDEQLRLLRGRHPKIGETEGMTVLARGYRDLSSEYRWSFLLAETLLQTEASVAYGTVAIGNASQNLVLTPADANVWSAAWKNRRILITGAPEPYKVSAFGSTTTATINAPFTGVAQTAAAYTLYRSEYPMPADADFGSEMLIWDVKNGLPLPLVSTLDIKLRESLQPGSVGYPVQAARVQLEADQNGIPLALLQFFPAPDAVYSFPVFYFKKQATIVGSARPNWPENYEDLIWRRAELELEENPRHRIVISQTARQKYYTRLWALKKTADGGAEIERRIALARSIGWQTWFRNMNFTSTGINPLVGG